jgi:hypothetical protein
VPEIEGLTFAEPTFVEFPKVLYAGVDVGGETLTVSNADEEAEALEHGFAPAAAVPAEEPVADEAEAPAKKKRGKVDPPPEPTSQVAPEA